MSSEDTNPPPAGVTDMDSAVRYLSQPEEAKEQAEETEAAQEPQHEAEAEEVEAAEDDEGSEVEETEESEDADDGADEDTEETEDEPRYTVKVDGEEYSVNLTELLSGYQKGADYTRKSSAVAEERRQLQSQAEQIEQMRGQLAAEYERVAALGQESEPDWAKLAKELDPWEYQQQRADWDVKQRQRAEAHHRAQAMQQQQTQRALVENAQRLLERIPEWRDPKRFETERSEMLQAAREYGFSDQEFMGAVDHRAFLMLRDALRGRKMREAEKKAPPAAKKVPKKAPTTLRPGAKATASESKAKEQDALRKNLRERGSVDDAVRFILGG